MACSQTGGVCTDLLFRTTFVEYANADVTGTLDPAPVELIHRVHIVPVTASGLVVVCQSQEGWRFLPGGRLEPSESLEAAIERELMEEAGARLVSQPTVFYAQEARSRADQPYMTGVPHPTAWWVYAWAKVDLVTAPTMPPGAEVITAVHTLPPLQAAAWLREDDRTHAAVVQLAHDRGVV